MVWSSHPWRYLVPLVSLLWADCNQQAESEGADPSPLLDTSGMVSRSGLLGATETWACWYESIRGSQRGLMDWGVCHRERG